MSVPPRRITVNLAPAEVRKSGPAYDLPIRARYPGPSSAGRPLPRCHGVQIVIGILLASEQIVAEVSSVLFLGELSLDGGLRHLHGVLPTSWLALAPTSDRATLVKACAADLPRSSARWSNNYAHRCPCGHYGDPTRACACPEAAASHCRKRLSGPLLDRIDLRVEVPRVEFEKLASDGLAGARGRVESARDGR